MLICMLCGVLAPSSAIYYLAVSDPRASFLHESDVHVCNGLTRLIYIMALYVQPCFITAIRQAYMAHACIVRIGSSGSFCMVSFLPCFQLCDDPIVEEKNKKRKRKEKDERKYIKDKEEKKKGQAKAGEIYIHQQPLLHMHVGSSGNGKKILHLVLCRRMHRLLLDGLGC